MTTLHYDPNHLFDTVKTQLLLSNDAALARLLGIAPPVISSIRSHKLAVGASLLINLHEETGWSIKELRTLMGDQRAKFTSIEL